MFVKKISYIKKLQRPDLFLLFRFGFLRILGDVLNLVRFDFISFGFHSGRVGALRGRSVGLEVGVVNDGTVVSLDEMVAENRNRSRALDQLQSDVATGQVRNPQIQTAEVGFSGR